MLVLYRGGDQGVGDECGYPLSRFEVVAGGYSGHSRQPKWKKLTKLSLDDVVHGGNLHLFDEGSAEF